MERAVRSNSGREMIGEWLNKINMETSTSSVNENNGDALQSSFSFSFGPSVETDEIGPVSDGAPPPAVTSDETNVADNEGINRRGIRLSNRHEAMYRATLAADCVASEMLLGEDPNLGSDVISEDGDRALHVAASMKHKDFVLKLLERVAPSELEMLDGRGYTACCYAAISGSVEIANLMMRKNPTIATARDRENETPLHKAALHGNSKMVSYFLKSTKIERLSKDEWFNLLLVTIRRKMYDVAIEILRRQQVLATMKNDEGTALHLLARQPFFLNRRQRLNGVMQDDMQLLAKQLWEGIQKLQGQESAIELMKNPPILHDAAEVGNVELITMLTHTYPSLAWQTNNKGYTIFHVIIKHRHENLLWLIDEIGSRKGLFAIWQDEDGNNILHLAAELAAPRSRILLMTAFEMQREILWFEKLRAIVPPLCLEMRNREGLTPAELFSKRHKSLLEESRAWMRNASDSCMLVSTLIFTMVFASAFAIPGAYNQVTGIPILLRTNWMTCFVTFEALSMLSSACSILCFLCIMVLGIKEGHFARNLPYVFVWGLIMLSFSLFGVVSVFMSAYFLVYVEKRAALIMTIIVVVYTLIVSAVCFQIYVLCISLPIYRFRKRTRHTLFKRTGSEIVVTRTRVRLPRIPDTPLSAGR
ncbi:hypothetical protein C2S51_006621 [Perilla frutescens var. frutescens]|nr:hypothetical protein C2S51_006621 [Perilla frutescens var. frutescens]